MTQHVEISYRQDVSAHAREHEPAVLMVHAFPFHSVLWGDVASVVKYNWKAVRPDLMGFGETPFNDACTIAEHAESIQRLIHKLGLGPCVICGISMGGYVAMELARSAPNLVCGLMLLNTRAVADTPDQKRGRQRMIRLVKRSGTRRVVEQLLPNLLSPAHYSAGGALLERVSLMMLDCPPTTIARACQAMHDREDCSEALGDFDIPVSVVTGEHDAITPVEVVQPMHDCLSDSELRVIRDAGHLTVVEQPELVALEIERLMGRVRRKNGGPNGFLEHARPTNVPSNLDGTGRMPPLAMPNGFRSY